jgi:hypothetical protein
LVTIVTNYHYDASLNTVYFYGYRLVRSGGKADDEINLRTNYDSIFIYNFSEKKVITYPQITLAEAYELN